MLFRSVQKNGNETFCCNDTVQWVEGVETYEGIVVKSDCKSTRVKPISEETARSWPLCVDDLVNNETVGDNFRTIDKVVGEAGKEKYTLKKIDGEPGELEEVERSFFKIVHRRIPTDKLTIVLHKLIVNWVRCHVPFARLAHAETKVQGESTGESTG